MDINELKSLLEEYEQRYYNDKEALISDEEYNALVKKYLELTGQEEYNFVPGEIKKGKKIKHPYPVISLAKVKITEIDKLKKEIRRLWPICIQWKLDGATLMFYENKEMPYIIITRGDGEYGEDKTEYAPFIKNIGKIPANNGVRCEAVIKRKDFEEINTKLIAEGKEPFKNARNALAGMLNKKIDFNDKSTYPEGISVIAYNMLNDTAGKKEILNLLKSEGWETVNTFYPKTEEEALDYILNFDFYDKNIDVDIDGLVIKTMQNKDFGSTGHHPLNAIAVKPETPEIWTELKDIEWSVGKTGLVTPTAIFEPVDILGSTIEKATLHNIAYMKAVGIDHINCTKNSHTQVKVTKANMIIPAILECRDIYDENFIKLTCEAKTILPPKTCPECDSKLEQINDQLYCRNPYCKEKIIAQAINMVSRDGLNIEGLSEETIRKMYNYLNIANDPLFCLHFDKEHLLKLEGFAEKSANNIFNEIQNKIKSVKMSNFLYACNIPLVGKGTAKLIAKNFKTIEDLCDDLNNNYIKLSNINGIGQEVINSIINNWNSIYALYDLINHIESEYIEQKISKDKQLSFVITGELSKPRKYFQNLIENKGHKVSSSVSRKTNYVVTNDSSEESTKLKRAKELNIKIINEKQMEEILNDF